MQKLEALAEEAKSNWASGGHQKDTMEATAIANAKALGAVQMLYGVIQGITEPAEEE